MQPLVSLQILRGLAAWMVVFHHYLEFMHDFKYSGMVGYFFARQGAFGVDLFFVLSGFVMCYSMQGNRYTAGAYLVNRAVRIVPVYWYYTLLLVPLAALFPLGFGYTDWTPESLLQSLLFMQHQNPSGLGLFPLLTVGWSLNFEVFFYLIMAISILLFKRHWFYGCLAVLILSPLAWPTAWPLHSLLASSLLFEFASGILICLVYLQFGLNGRMALPFALLLLLIAVLMRSQLLAAWMAETSLIWRFADTKDLESRVI